MIAKMLPSVPKCKKADVPYGEKCVLGKLPAGVSSETIGWEFNIKESTVRVKYKVS